MKSGYSFPEKSAVRLMRRQQIKDEIARLDKQRRTTDKDVATGFSRLAFGCVSDAVSLAFTDDISLSDIEKMDLFNISEIKRKKGGDIEIKFFDRLKALEKLAEISKLSFDEEESSIFGAIEKSAVALRNESYE